MKNVLPVRIGQRPSALPFTCDRCGGERERGAQRFQIVGDGWRLRGFCSASCAQEAAVEDQS